MLAIDYNTQQFLKPEEWGARSVRDPRDGDYELAQANSTAFEKMFGADY